MKKQFIEGGRIVNTHGVRGEVKIDVWTDSPEFLGKIKTLYIDGVPHSQESARPHKGMLLSKLSGVDDINAAMLLKGKLVTFDRADAPLRPGSYFNCDLLGAKCVDSRGGEIGVLTQVMEAPAGMVYVIEGESEHLVPAVPEFVKSVDADSGLIVLELIEGM